MGAIVRFERSFWAEKLQDEEFYYSKYLSWWDHFKDINFPKWLKKRCPVRKQRISLRFKRWAKFPKFKWFSDRDKEEFVILETMEVIRDEF